MPISVLVHLSLIIGAALFGGLVAKRFGQPAVVGYLLAGVLVGLFVKGFENETVAYFSELGVVFLLFTLGLEFNSSRIKKVASVALYGGLAQILLTMMATLLLLQISGISPFTALFMAAAFSLSSTAIVVKLLTDKNELQTLPGEIMVGWLIVQDLAVLPMLVFLPVFGKFVLQTGDNLFSFTQIVQQLGFSVLLLGIFLFLGKKYTPVVIGKIAEFNNRELLLVAVFLLAILAALFTQSLGLSAAIGAFLAGFFLSESREQHAVFSEIRPLRDIFALLFFTTLGLILPAGFIFANLWQIILLALVVMAIKFVIVVGLSSYFGYHSKTSFLVGVGLIEVGEFAFILARLGISERLIDEQSYALILSVTLVSILLTPPLFLAAPALYAKLREQAKAKLPGIYFKFFSHIEHRDTLVQLPLKDHVVLCGYGRVGKYIGRALSFLQVPYIVIEYNHHTVSQLRRNGIHAVYGDPSDIEILDYAQVDTARSIVIAIPDLQTQKMVISNSLKLNPKIDIYCRTHIEDHQKLLRDMGAEIVVQPEFEASLAIISKLLSSFGHKQKIIEGKISRLKIEHGLV